MRAAQGVLIECDPAIRALIVKLEQETGARYVLEELDEQHLLVSSKTLGSLKTALDKKLAEATYHQDSDEDTASD